MFNKNLVIIILSVICCTLILEITLRLFHADKWPVNYYCRDKLSGLISASPNYTGYCTSEYGKAIIKTNKYGCRGDVFNQQKESFKVLILGDSYVLANQVNLEDTFGFLLSKSDACNVQVMQVGIPSWGEGDEFQWLFTYCDQLKPDIVVLAVFLGNDLTIDNMKKDNLGSSSYVISKYGLVDVKENDNFNTNRHEKVKLINKIKQYTIHQSALYIFVRKKISLLQSNKKKQIIVKDDNNIIITPSDRRRLGIYLVDKDKREIYYSTFFKLLQQFISLGKEKHFELIPMIIPWHMVMDKNDFNYVLEQNDLSKDEYSISIPVEVINEYAKRNKINYVDLYEVFMRHENPRRAYGKKDLHFSLTGHRWVAQELERFLDNSMGLN